MDREPAKAARTVTGPRRPFFTMKVPPEAYARIEAVAKSTGDTVSVAASKIVCYELGARWEPPHVKMTPEELREARNRRARRHYALNRERESAKSAERMSANRERYRDAARARRHEAGGRRLRSGERRGVVMFQYPEEWEALGRKEMDRLRTAVRQAAYNARKDVGRYREALVAMATAPVVSRYRVVGGEGLTKAHAKGRHADDVETILSSAEELRGLDEAMACSAKAPERAVSAKSVADARRSCAHCRFFNERYGYQVCLRFGFRTDRRARCGGFVDWTKVTKGVYGEKALPLRGRGTDMGLWRAKSGKGKEEEECSGPATGR